MYLHCMSVASGMGISEMFWLIPGFILGILVFVATLLEQAKNKEESK